MISGKSGTSTKNRGRPEIRKHNDIREIRHIQKIAGIWKFGRVIISGKKRHIQKIGVRPEIWKTHDIRETWHIHKHSGVPENLET